MRCPTLLVSNSELCSLKSDRVLHLERAQLEGSSRHLHTDRSTSSPPLLDHKPSAVALEWSFESVRRCDRWKRGFETNLRNNATYDRQDWTYVTIANGSPRVAFRSFPFVSKQVRFRGETIPFVLRRCRDLSGWLRIDGWNLLRFGWTRFGTMHRSADCHDLATLQTSNPSRNDIVKACILYIASFTSDASRSSRGRVQRCTTSFFSHASSKLFLATFHFPPSPSSLRNHLRICTCPGPLKATSESNGLTC